MLSLASCALPLLFALTQQAVSKPQLMFTAPAEWTPRAAASAMRVAEFVLPKAAGDPEDGETVVFFFGGQGGDVEANVTRWIGQMQQPDGRPSKDLATRTSRTVNGLPVTIVDVGGTYVAEVRPGSAEHFNKPGFHLRAAVVQTAGGPYFIKMLGPERTVARWRTSFDELISTVQYRQ